MSSSQEQGKKKKKEEEFFFTPWKAWGAGFVHIWNSDNVQVVSIALGRYLKRGMFPWDFVGEKQTATEADFHLDLRKMRKKATFINPERTTSGKTNAG